MDSWGAGPFENSAARALVAGLPDHDPEQAHLMLCEAMSAVADAPAGADLSEETVAEGVAAAVVMAAWSGGPTPPDAQARGWVERNGPAQRGPDTLGLARRALDRSLDPAGNGWFEARRAGRTLPDAVREVVRWRGGLRPAGEGPSLGLFEERRN